MAQTPDRRQAVIEDIAEFNCLLRRAIDVAARWRGLHDENVIKLRQFIEIVRAGDVPPKELLEHVAASFQDYLASRSSKSLTSLLGPKKHGQGKKEFFAAWEKLERDCRLMLHLHLLVKAGKPIDAAAEEVAEWFTTPPIVHGRVIFPKSKYFERRLSAETLRNEYGRNWDGKSWADVLDEAVGDSDPNNASDGA